MTILKENKATGISCGINNDGELFFGITSEKYNYYTGQIERNHMGYNLPDTPDNRQKILADFEYCNK